MMRNTVSEVEVDKALVRNTSVNGYALGVVNNILGQAHGD
jgi:hypothetical protein